MRSQDFINFRIIYVEKNITKDVFYETSCYKDVMREFSDIPPDNPDDLTSGYVVVAKKADNPSWYILPTNVTQCS